jgi:hypothetical protein
MSELIFYAASGLLLLFFGRFFFWLFVGAVGFIFGLEVAFRVFHLSGDFAAVLLALLCAAVAAVLVIFFYRFTISMAGFLAGGYVAVQLWMLWTGHLNDWSWIVFFMGAIPGFLLTFILLDPAIIVLSSFMGASLCVSAFPKDPVGTPVGWVLLSCLGAGFQMWHLVKSKKSRPPLKK